MFRWLKRSPRADTIQALYGAIVAQGRNAAFYADYGVADTPEGRFDLILLHLILFVRRLRPEPAPIRALGQGVFDLFCRDMDHSFREMGIGDLAVPKHMRRVAEAFYGRAAAYDAAIERADDEQLAVCWLATYFPNRPVRAPARNDWRDTCAARLTRWIGSSPETSRKRA